jgi:hypothetical protein
MNERRIEELAKQAGEYVNSVYTPPVRSKTPDKIWEDGHVDWHTQFNQKFAELIVQECIKTIEYRAPGQMGKEGEGWTNGYDDGLKTGAWLLKEHFGVEE